MKKWFAVCAVLSFAALGVMALAGATQEGVRAGGAQGNGASEPYEISISADARFVVFLSEASNLVAGDTNRAQDIFVRDLHTGKTERVNVSSEGREANAGVPSVAPHMSPDGRFVCFQSSSSNLVPGDTNGKEDVFLRDREKRTTERVNISSAGAQGDEWSGAGRVTPDGRFVVFDSQARNLVRGGARPVTVPALWKKTEALRRDYISAQSRDVYVRDRQKGTTERVSVNSAGRTADRPCNVGAISPDGRFVAFQSDATNLAPGPNLADREIFLRDRLKHTTERISGGIGSVPESRAFCMNPHLSADGRFVYFERFRNVFRGDPLRQRSELFVRDREKGTTERVPLIATAGEPEPWLRCRLSPDGRFAVLDRVIENPMPGPYKFLGQIVFVDRKTQKTELMRVSSTGRPANGSCFTGSVSADGRFVCFGASASNLVPDDTNGCKDVFVRDRVLGTTTRVSVSSAPPG
jgi:Tol biopolymer transport system component